MIIYLHFSRNKKIKIQQRELVPFTSGNQKKRALYYYYSYFWIRIRIRQMIRPFISSGGYTVRHFCLLTLLTWTIFFQHFSSGKTFTQRIRAWPTIICIQFLFLYCNSADSGRAFSPSNNADVTFRSHFPTILSSLTIGHRLLFTWNVPNSS